MVRKEASGCTHNLSLNGETKRNGVGNSFTKNPKEKGKVISEK
ncbi:hypothetical protein A33Q_3715 [Indibacter alkaliphilus LW1]|uniref:Uncharacterized protein n=1 Tax=Indibacter alkaliphilus (strain CCUG 57479 / KCTC 22604 / LW1) TaxID=1189612 RepID=S2D4B1_INDAL|nr:hypothetical protein A33Q_3715 [Indibacter alkaliphilus LW1]